MKASLIFAAGSLVGYCFAKEPQTTLGALMLVGLAGLYGYLVTRNEQYRLARLEPVRIPRIDR
jgi:hypothetical protein